VQNLVHGTNGPLSAMIAQLSAAAKQTHTT
jgi:hypothetical protein